ncbi:MAG: urease accessory UreF family protein [Pseudomonadales bacterium]|nr:urease accessory UreF family protein [Pseudomonadales bacterium]
MSRPSSFLNLERIAMACSSMLTSTDLLMTDAGLLRLLQLSSAVLPVGAYAFSQGLEYAIGAGWLQTPEDIARWLEDQLRLALARVDIPILYRIFDMSGGGHSAALDYWNACLLACRETRELRLGDTATGLALRRLLRQLDVPVPALKGEPAFATLFAVAARHWGIGRQAAALGLVWSWLENQVAAATKLLPLGQTQAQGLLSRVQQQIPAALTLADALQDHELGASLPGLALASCQHETQYTRLFRS